MSKSKLSRWLMRGAFTLATVAAVSMLSAEQANAQFYGTSRGISVGSFGRTGGFSLSIGNVGPSYGYGNRRPVYGGYGYGGGLYSAYGGGINNFYRVPAVTYYRPPVAFYGNRGGGNRGGFVPHHYSRNGNGRVNGPGHGHGHGRR